MLIFKKLWPLLIIVLLSHNLYSDNYKTTHSDSIDVLHYTIDLNIDWTGEEISGYTNLVITPNIDNLDKISLDLLALTIDSITMNSVLMTNYTYDDTLLNVIMTSNLMQDDTVSLSVYYHGHPTEDPSGFGGFSFSGSYVYSIGVAFEDNPHNYGRVWYPCIDDFVDRATYDFYITTDSGKVAVCNGLLIDEIYPGNGTVTYHWHMADEIPTYLANVAVAEYVAVRDTFNGMYGQIPIAIYVLQSDSSKAVNSFINIKDILSGYEQAFGPYRWNRVGFSAVPLGGGMEHATNIAYGYYLITGDLTYEWLYAHEISHHWFGDLVTCEEAEEMWLNEGWAVYSEAVFTEHLYGRDAYREYVKDNHREVVRYAHIEDGGYRALVGVPHEYTYGTTVYDKGGDVAHSIRGYMGDSLFFPAIKHYLDSFAFSDASSEDLRNVLSDESGLDMTDFFDAWVYQPGFVHFSIDSLNILNSGSDYDVTVYMKQKLKGAVDFANSNRVEVTFMSANWEAHTVLVEFDGEMGSQTFTIPFYPVSAMVDYEERLSDAITAHYEVLNSTGLSSSFYEDCYFRLNVEAVSDSAFLRVEHNWVAPDPLKTLIPNLNLSDYRYWKVSGIFPADFVTKGVFRYNTATTGSEGYLDNTLITTSYIDSLTLLYRPDAGSDWQLINHTRSGSAASGYMIVDTLLLGEYTLAFYDHNVWDGIKDKKVEENLLTVYPNPSSDEFIIEFDVKNHAAIDIYTLTGEKVFHENIFSHQMFVKWKPADLKHGIFILRISESGKKPLMRKLIYY